jgi:ribosome-binding protein aMBF1 (putative translation factor)
MNRAKRYRNRSTNERLHQISPTKKQQVGTRMQIAVNLDEALQAKGWKRTQLAEALQVDRSLITKWLSGSHNFTIDTLVQLSVILDITLADLVSDRVTSFSPTSVIV